MSNIHLWRGIMEEKQNGEVEKAAAAKAIEPGLQELEPGGNRQKGRKKKYVIIILFLVFFILLALTGYAYYRGVVYYRTHFLPNTNINGIDCSDMETAPVVDMLDARVGSYSLSVIGRDYKTSEPGTVLGVIVPDDIGLHFADTDIAVGDFLQQQNEMLWFQAYMGDSFSYSLNQDVVFEEERLQSTVESWDACKKKNMQVAKDAYISEYSDEIGGYEVIPETLGTQLDMEEAIRLISETVSRQDGSLDLEEAGCYREAAVRSDDKKLNDIVDTANRWLGTEIEYDWNGTEVVLNHEILKDWVTIEGGEPVLDEEAVAAFVKEQASAYDTYGKKKKFMTTHGFEMTLNSRNYGWKTDTAGETEELTQLIYHGTKTEREPLYSITARQKGANDIGNSYVEADLSNQHLYLYQDGEIVVETDFVSGTMISSYDCVTPEGIFGLTYKTMNAVLKGATYRTPVKYWMPFYGNYGMHDANWRGAFGGEIFKTNGSHGCINLPPSMAGQIYQYVSEGFPVVCYYSQGIPYVGPPAVPAEGVPEGGIPDESVPVDTPAEAPVDTPAEIPAETPAEVSAGLSVG